MQTFLTSPDFRESATTLDRQRLGKQRVEVKQLATALWIGPTLRGKATPWYNHPAARMWNGYEQALLAYGVAICEEWIDRGYNDSILEWIGAFAEITGWYYWETHHYPPWFNDPDFFSAHRAILLGKAKESGRTDLIAWYAAFGWAETPAVRNKDGKWPYIWPVSKE